MHYLKTAIVVNLFLIEKSDFLNKTYVYITFIGIINLGGGGVNCLYE